MPVPSPEELQYLLGIHPDQVQAQQSLDNAEPVEVAPKPSLIPRPGPRALDVPPVGSPGPVENSVVSGVDAAGRPTLVPRGPGALPVGAVPPAPKPTSAPPPEPVDMGGIRNLMTTPIRPISGDQARENSDRSELDRLRSTGSGVDQFMHRHKFLGPLVKGLSIAGSILSPGAAEAIPGTDLHHEGLVRQAEGNVARDIGDEKAHSQMAVSEEAERAKEEANRTSTQNLKDKIEQQNSKFVAGSEHEDPNSPTGYVAQTIGGEWKPFTPPQSYKQGKGEGFEEVQRAREKEADRMGLTGDKRTSYIANGKIAEPGTHIHVPSAASEELEMWKTAFKTEHGRDPNSGEILEYKRGGGAKASQHTFKDTAAIDKYSNDWYQKQRKSVLEEKAKVKSLNPEAADDDKQLQQEYARIENEYKQRTNDFETQKKNWYAQVQGGNPVKIDEPEGGGVPEPDTSDIPQPIASVRPPGPAPIGGPVQTPEKTAKPSPSTPVAQPKPGDIIGTAPADAHEGRTGKLPDGTRVIVKGGKLVAQ
jgi:hypothetical protein